MSKRDVVVAAVLALILAGGVAAAQVQVDSALPAYKAVSGVSGNLSSVGSDTLNNLMTLWAETFNKFYPNAKIQVEGKGSSTAPPALIAGTAQLGPMSRPMKGTGSTRSRRSMATSRRRSVRPWTPSRCS